MLSNLYLYSVGYNPRRRNLVNRIVSPDPDVEPQTQASVVRVRHGGAFDPEPFFAPQLVGLAHNRIGMSIDIQTVDASNVGDADLALLTTAGETSDPLDAAATAALRAYLQGGGTLFVDAAGGSNPAVDAVNQIVSDLLPDARVAPLPSTHPVITGHPRRAGPAHPRLRQHPHPLPRFYALRKMQPTRHDRGCRAFSSTIGPRSSSRKRTSPRALPGCGTGASLATTCLRRAASCSMACSMSPSGDDGRARRRNNFLHFLLHAVGRSGA